MVLRTRIPALTYFGMKVLNIETWALAATIHKNRHVFTSMVARWYSYIPKCQLWYILEGSGMENGCIFYGHLVYFLASCYILWSFGIICGNFMYFALILNYMWPFGIFLVICYILTRRCSKPIWQPCVVRETDV
jgi:hypothetical protein